MAHYTSEDGVNDIYFHGIPYTDFDKTGHWSIVGQSRLFEVSRRFFFATKLDFPSAHGHVVSRLRITIKEGLHNRVNLQSKFIPLYKVSLKELGNTSLTLSSELFDKLTGEYCGENISLVVKIDPVTRKPEANLPYFKNNYSNLYQSPSLVWSRDKIRRPQTVFSTVTKIRFSDHDIQGHLNNSNYISLCMDCASDAATSGFYRHYDTEMYWYAVLELDIRYLLESRANDVLTINTWQDEHSVQKIYFEITRDETLITEATFMFHLEKSDPL